MNDIVTRLRDWRNVHLARLHILMDEAADEMERLSKMGDCPDRDNAANEDNTPATHGTPSEGSEQSGCTLSDEEREAVEYFAAFHQSPREADATAAATLRGLLERL
jgi:hypothetical protein